ncbi:hypothetical protein GP486_007845, partial [Trichoglossum hirsutum]
MISDALYQTILSSATVTSLLAENPIETPGDVAAQLYGEGKTPETLPELRKDIRKEDLERAYECGSLPDVARHMANCIARATTEVFLATNFWAYGDNTTIITDALRELSRCAGQRGQQRKVVVKVIYDRGSIKQGSVRLPAPEEIPNIDMQVVNYHRPLLGTFHSKYVIIDREIALLMSCNIQDTDNLEMMCHFEGPIVDSFYDMALISWDKALEPPLPMLERPASVGEWCEGSSDQPGPYQDSNGTPIGEPADSHTSSDGSGYITPPSTLSATHTATPDELSLHTTDDPHYDPDIVSEALRVQTSVSPSEGVSRMQAVTKHLSTRPFILNVWYLIRLLLTLALGNTSACTPQNLAWLSGIHRAQSCIFIQTPTFNAQPLIPALLDAVKRGVEVRCYLTQGYSDAGELLPMQGGTNEMVVHDMYSSLDLKERENLHVHYYVAKDQIRPINARFKQRSSH